MNHRLHEKKLTEANLTKTKTNPKDTICRQCTTQPKVFKCSRESCQGNLNYKTNHSVFLIIYCKNRMLLAFLLILVLQKQLDSFRQTVWNTHRIRTQKDTFLPDGVPDHIYEFPEKYGLEDCGK